MRTTCWMVSLIIPFFEWTNHCWKCVRCLIFNERFGLTNINFMIFANQAITNDVWRQTVPKFITWCLRHAIYYCPNIKYKNVDCLGSYILVVKESKRVVIVISFKRFKTTLGGSVVCLKTFRWKKCSSSHRHSVKGHFMISTKYKIREACICQ